MPRKNRLSLVLVSLLVLVAAGCTRNAGQNPQPEAASVTPTATSSAGRGENPLSGIVGTPDVRTAVLATSTSSPMPQATTTPSPQLSTLPTATALPPATTAIYTASGDPCTRSWRPPTAGGAGENPLAGIIPAPSQAEIVKLAHARPVSFAAFSTDGAKLVTADGETHLWDAATAKPLLTVAEAGQAGPPALSPDGHTLAAAEGDGTVHLWDAETGAERQVLTGTITEQDLGIELPEQLTQSNLTSVAFSPDGRTLAASRGPLAILWDLASGIELRRFKGQIIKDPNAPPPMLTVTEGHAGKILWLGFSPNGQALLTAGGDGSVRLWDVATGQHLRCLGPGHGTQDNFGSAAFSPDGKLAAGVAARTVYVWNATSGQLQYELKVPYSTKRFNWATFSPDSTTLLTAGDDHAARLWDLATGDLTGLLPHPAPLYGAGFSPDGTRVVTAMGEYSPPPGQAPRNAAWIWRLDRARLALSAQAQKIAQQGVEAVLGGDSRRGLELFAQAQAVNPDRDYDLAAAGRAAAFSVLAAQAETLVRRGGIPQALKLVAAAIGLAQRRAGDPRDLDKLCTIGTLWGKASDVLTLCDLSVAQSDPGVYPVAGNYDSRGIARALAGDYQGAIADFQYSEQNGGQSAPLFPVAQGRKAWIAALQGGHNPIDDTVLDDLRQEFAFP